MALHRFIRRVRDNKKDPGDDTLLFLMGLLTIAIIAGLAALVIAYTEVVLAILAFVGGAIVLAVSSWWLCRLVGRHIDVPFLAKLIDHGRWLEKMDKEEVEADAERRRREAERAERERNDERQQRQERERQTSSGHRY